jgi:hypothetical protein
MKKLLIIFAPLLFCNQSFAKLPDNLDLNSICLILEDKGLSGRSPINSQLWRNYYEDEYGCISNYKELEASSPYKAANNLSFYVNGDSKRANKIYLSLNINDRAKKISALNSLKETSSTLYKRIAKKELPKDVLNHIDKAKPLKRNIDGYDVKVELEGNPQDKKHSYSVQFIIE